MCAEMQRGLHLNGLLLMSDFNQNCKCQQTELQAETRQIYVEIKCQLDAADYFYCRSYCLLNMFRAPLCPSSGSREYYTSGCRLLYLVLWFSSCRYGVEPRVVCPVCELQLYNTLELLTMGIIVPETC